MKYILFQKRYLAKLNAAEDPRQQKLFYQQDSKPVYTTYRVIS